MTTALQSPLRHREARALGQNVFRKQVLPKQKITYDGRDIEFTDDYLASLVDAFSAPAFDQVPFVLVDPETNKHTNDPERFRGQVKGFELAGDGLDMIVELSPDGAKLVRENPKLGVSARILEDIERADGRRFPRAIQHVAGTFDPEIGGLREWSSVSDLSAFYGHSQVVDLTGMTYADEMADKPETQKPEFSEEEAKQLRALLAKGSESPSERSGGSPPPAGGLPDDLSDDERAAVEEFITVLREDEPETPAAEAETPEPAAALSAEHQRAIDLAAEQSKREIAELRGQLAAKDFLAEKNAYVSAGVPPSAVDLAKPALMHKGTIDLSHDDKVDVGKIARGLLDELKGTIDLSGEQGSSASPEGAEREEADKLLKQMDDQFGTKTVKAAG